MRVRTFTARVRVRVCVYLNPADNDYRSTRILYYYYVIAVFRREQLLSYCPITRGPRLSVAHEGP